MAEDRKLYRSYKTELKPTEAQARKMRQNMGVCRFLYNSYINMNTKLFRMYMRGLLDEHQDRFITAIDFDKYINRRIKVQPRYAWINGCGSKARKKALTNAQRAYSNFFNSRSCFPRFKSRHGAAVKLYFPRNNASDWKFARSWVRIPTFGTVRLKEYGYLPEQGRVVSGTVSYRAGRFYLSVLVEVQREFNAGGSGEIEVSFDAECLMRCGSIAGEDVEARSGVQKLKKRLHREHRSLRRKLLQSSYSSHIEAQRLYIDKLHLRLERIRLDYLHKLAAKLLALEPRRIICYKLTEEDKQQKNTVQLRRLYYIFCEQLAHKAQLRGIEVDFI